MSETTEQAIAGRTEQTKQIGVQMGQQIAGGLILALIIGMAASYVTAQTFAATTEVRLTKAEREIEILRDDMREVKEDSNQNRWILEGKQGAKK